MINDDDDDDWENTETIVLNIEQLKRIQEQKLIEESDTALARELFEEDETLKEMRATELKQNKIKSDETTSNHEIKYENKLKKNTVYNSKKEENELKQKEISKKIKEQKMLKQKHIELFGEAETNDDEYADYEDKYL